MENASKALLIAGSILVVILLIAVGVRIFNSTQGTTDSVQTTMTATEITTFNNKFLSYGGTKSKSQVISLINIVIANNSVNSTKKVKVNGKDSTSDLSTTLNSISSDINKLNYNVSFTFSNGTQGLINGITIS